MQQLLKLGAVHSIPTLSSWYIIWDSDMIPLQPIRMFLPAGADVKPRLNIAPIRVTQYEASYQRLFNDNVIYPHGRGTSFVSHSMIIKRTYMLEMLQTIAGPGNRDKVRMPDAEEACVGDHVT